MHSAPSVSYPVGRSAFGGTLLLLLWIGAAGCLWLWWAQPQSAGPWLALAAAALLFASGLWAATSWWRAPTGTLGWNGQAWTWPVAGQGADHAVHVGLDLQRWMLVRCRAGRATSWLWLERGRAVERWDDLRRAVYSRAREQSPARAQAPPAKS